MGAGGRSLVVIGASAGGVEALTRLAAGLPPDFAAPIAVVLHVPSTGKSVLPAILTRNGNLPASAATDGERLTPGHIHVAPPGRHLLVRDGALALDDGPRHDGHRPAIDPLFTTAAAEGGAAVIGVILTGTLHDGTAGLAEIKLHGGTTVVQDPEDAQYPSMPAHAIERVAVDHVVPLDRMAALIVELVGVESEGEAA